MTTKRRYFVGEMPKHIALLLALVFTFAPIWLMLVISTKSNIQYYNTPLWLPSRDWGQIVANYREAIETILPFFLNSVIITVTMVAGVLVISSLAGFVMGCYRFPGRDLFYYSLLGIMAFPGVLTLVPAYLVTRSLGLKGMLMGVWLPQIAFWQPLGIFLLRNAYAAIPQELFDAARMDGASAWQELRYIGVPMTGAMLGTLAILGGTAAWNDYVWALVVLAEKRGSWPLTVGLVHQLHNFWAQYGLQMASYTLAAVPLLLVFALGTRYFTAGLTSGVLKG
jgi:ABC-type glycerol-3-phosphate transport system permease component